MAVQLLKVKKFQGAYSPNIISLDGADQGKVYVLRVYATNQSDLLADLRIQPNQQNIGVVDIKNILESYIGKLPITFAAYNEDAHAGNDWIDNDGIIFPYKLQYGQVNPGNTPDPASLIWYKENGMGPVTVFQATTERRWRTQATDVGYTPTGDVDYQAIVVPVEGGTCPEMQKIGTPMTDAPVVEWKDLPGASFPNYQNGDTQISATTQVIYCGKIDADSILTTSWFSPLASSVSNANGITGAVIATMAPNGLVWSENVLNIQSNGGGPNTSVGDGFGVSFPYSIATLNASPKDRNTGTFTPGSRLIVYPFTYNSCSEFIDSPSVPTHFPMVWDIVDTTCQDYPHIQLGWLNSRGWMDYFLFNKRSEKSVNITRKSYLKDIVNYDSATAGLLGINDPAQPYQRGTTTYAQSYATEWTVRTDYVSDTEAKFLESLYRSPEVYAWMSIEDSPYGSTKAPYAIELLSNNYVEKSMRKDGLFQLEIRFRMAQHEYSQRG